MVWYATHGWGGYEGPAYREQGYIGTAMAPIMVGAGHEVVGVDADLYRRSTFGAWTEAIRTVPKDLRALEARDVQGFDAVVHLAALSNDPLGALNPQLTFDINHLARCAWPRSRRPPA